MYKMCQINKKAYKNVKLKLLTTEDTFGLIEEIWKQNQITQIGHKFWTDVIQKNKKHRHELIPNTIFQLSRVFVRNDLPERKIKSRRLASKQFLDFKEKLVLDPCKINFEEQDIISALQAAFEGEIIHTQYCIENTRLCVQARWLLA